MVLRKFTLDDLLKFSTFLDSEEYVNIAIKMADEEDMEFHQFDVSFALIVEPNENNLVLAHITFNH